MPDQVTVAELLASARTVLREHGKDTPGLDAKLLFMHASGFSEVDLISRETEVASSVAANQFSIFLERRLNGEPVHRITGVREFYGRSFVLSPETLVPRPDTETLIECVLGRFGVADAELRILEIGTGSGIIAVTLAAELKNASFVATDVNSAALSTAKKNAEAHDVAHLISFQEADVFQGVTGKFNLIVSNPPYIPTQDIDGLQEEVTKYDPRLALDGGSDGLNFYRKIFEDAETFLEEPYGVFVEIGFDQQQVVSEIANENGFKVREITKDMAGMNRVMYAEGGL